MLSSGNRCGYYGGAGSAEFSRDIANSTAGQGDRKLIDELEIQRIIARFANSFDLNDWGLMESALADTLTVVYTDLRGDIPHEITAEDYVSAHQQELGPLNTQHLIGNLEVEVTGDTATVRAGSVIYRSLGERYFNTHASYQFGLTRESDRGWLIGHIKQTVLWSEGDPDIQSGIRGNG